MPREVQTIPNHPLLELGRRINGRTTDNHLGSGQHTAATAELGWMGVSEKGGDGPSKRPS